MAIDTDFEIQNDGDIRWVGTSGTYTVLELHRWLQGLADDAAASGDDFMDIVTSTPSERSTDNIITLNTPFNIDDTAAQHLYDGSITQVNPVTSETDIYAGLVVVGAVETGTQLQIWQDEAILTSFWSTGLNADANASILNRVLVKVKANGAAIDGQRIIVYARELGDTYAEFAVTMGLGNNTAAIFTGPDLNNDTASGTIATWTTIANTEGYQLYDISGDGADEAYYSQWDKDIYSAKQMYERTKYIARRGTAEVVHSFSTAELFRGITHSFDYDGEATSPTEDAVLAWGTSFAYDGGTGTVPAVGQYWENTTAGGFGKIVWVSSAAGATGTVVVQREATTPAWADNDVYALRGGTGSITQAGTSTAPTTSLGGSARLLAKLDSGTTGTLWVQLISGTIAGDNDPIWQRGGTTGAYVTCNGAATARTVSPEFLGTYTGSSIIGAYGIGIVPADGIAADLFTPLTGSAISPPNNQVYTVSGLVSGEDRVLVCVDAGLSDPAPDLDRFTLNTSLTGATETAVVLTGAIPADTPASTTASGGQTYLRIQLDNGAYRQVAFTSWTGSTFTIASTDFSTLTATAPRNVFLAYIDVLADSTEESVTLKYLTDRSMFVRVRDGGGTPIKTFESRSTFGTGGGSATAIRTSDA